MDDLRRIQHFLAAARHGSLTRAALSLDLSQPALSKSIQSLEASLGVRLFERHRWGVALTADGELLLTHAQAAQESLRFVQNQLRERAGLKARQVSVGCGPAEQSRLIAQALELMRVRFPDVRATVLYGLNESLMPMVKRGEIDLAVSAIPSNAKDAALDYEALYSEDAVVVARIDHPLVSRSQLNPADLARYPWVLAKRREFERRALDELFLAAGQDPIVAQVETTSGVLMKTLVMQSDFLTFLPRELVHWELRSGSLAILRGVRSTWIRTVGVTRQKNRLPSPVVEAVVAWLRQAAQRMRVVNRLARAAGARSGA